MHECTSLLLHILVYCSDTVVHGHRSDPFGLNGIMRVNTLRVRLLLPRIPVRYRRARYGHRVYSAKA